MKDLTPARLNWMPFIFASILTVTCTLRKLKSSLMSLKTFHSGIWIKQKEILGRYEDRQKKL